MSFRAVVQNGVIRIPPGSGIPDGTEVEVFLISPAGVPSTYGDCDENGVDLSLIRENLRLTPLERVRKADRARRQTLALLQYGRQHRENTARQESEPHDQVCCPVIHPHSFATARSS